MSASSGGPEISFPFGNMSLLAAQRYGKQFSNPLSWGFGLGTGRRAQNFNDKLASGEYDDSPIAQYVMQGRELGPQLYGDAQKAGQDIASRAPGAFSAFNDQIQGYLQQLPELQDIATQAAQGSVDTTGRTNQMVDQAFEGIQNQALYQESLRRALEGSQPGAAARGLLDSGSQAGREEGMARDLSYQFAGDLQNQRLQALQAQGSAQQNQQQLAGGAADLGQAGIGAAGQLMNALPGYAQLLMSGSQLPAQALGQFFSILSGAQMPTMGLQQSTQPVVAQENKSSGFW